jgi:hypothetical protein
VKSAVATRTPPVNAGSYTGRSKLTAPVSASNDLTVGGAPVSAPV